MVLLHYKSSEKNQFIYEGQTTQQIQEVKQQLVQINNLRVKIDKLLQNLQGLAEFGPLRPEALRGLSSPETYNPACETLTEEEKKYAHPQPSSNQIKNPDTHAQRTGIAPNKQLALKIIDTIQQVQQLITEERANKRKGITIKELQDGIDLIKGAIMIVYPGYYGLPEWDPVYQILEDKINLKAIYPDCDWKEETKVNLWWAKKELKENKLLSDYIGKNEKTKIIIKFGLKGQGAPMAEPPIDKDTQKKMMHFYYKKQEEAKKLEENNEDNYLDSDWANPHNLKYQLLNGGRDLRFK